MSSENHSQTSKFTRSSLLFGDASEINVNKSLDNLRSKDGLDDSDLERLLNASTNNNNNKNNHYNDDYKEKDKQKADTSSINLNQTASNWSNSHNELASTVNKSPDKNDILYKWRMQRKIDRKDSSNHQHTCDQIAAGDQNIQITLKKPQNFITASPATTHWHIKNERNLENLTELLDFSRDNTNIHNNQTLLQNQSALKSNLTSNSDQNRDGNLLLTVLSQLKKEETKKSETTSVSSENKTVKASDNTNKHQPQIQKIILKDTESQTIKLLKRNVCIQHSSKAKTRNMSSQTSPPTKINNCSISCQTETDDLSQNFLENLKFKDSHYISFSSQSQSDITAISEPSRSRSRSRSRSKSQEPRIDKKSCDFSVQVNIDRASVHSHRMHSHSQEESIDVSDEMQLTNSTGNSKLLNVPEILEEDQILAYLNKKQTAVLKSIEEIDKFLSETEGLV